MTSKIVGLLCFHPIINFFLIFGETKTDKVRVYRQMGGYADTPLVAFLRESLGEVWL